MACNCNNTNPCGGGCIETAPCVEKDCACPVFISSDCVNNVTETLPCSNIVKGQTLTAVLKQLDAFICAKFDQLTAFVTLINVGGGKEIYKGVNGVGQKVLRTLVKVGNLITLNQTTDTVEIGLDEIALAEIVASSRKNYTVVNIGGDDNNGVYKDSTVLTPNSTQFNLKPIVSTTLEVNTSVDGNRLEINMPASATIPAMYVNNRYIPTYKDFLNGGAKGLGTIAKPFTDTVNYTNSTTRTIIPNTAIQNALDAYAGGSRLNPARIGERIIIQNNNTGYTFTGDFNYTGLLMEIQGEVNVNPIVPNTYLVDMDNPANFNQVDGSYLFINLADGAILDVTNSLGFNNSGTTNNTAPIFEKFKQIQIYGEGELFSEYNGGDVLTRYMFNGNGDFNDSSLHYDIRCNVKNAYSGIYFLKNNTRIDFYNKIRSSEIVLTVNPALRAFHMTGGQVRFYDKASISFNGGWRVYGFTFEPTLTSTINFKLNSAQVVGNSNYCFAKLSDGNVNLLAFNSPSGDGFATVNSSNAVVAGLFENLGSTRWGVNFKNNVFSYTGIDHTKVDLTLGNGQSVTNFIGNDVVENLVTSRNRAQAILDGRPLYSAYLKTNNITYPNTSTWVRDIVLPA